MKTGRREFEMQLFMNLKPILILLCTAFLSIPVAAEVQVTPPVAISAPGQAVLEAPNNFRFQISPDSEHVIYPVSTPGTGLVQLFSIPIGGGNAVQLSSAAVGSLLGYRISSDSNWVVYRTFNGLYSVPLTGGTSSRLDPVDRVQSIDAFQFTSNSQHIVYNNGVGALWSVNIDGTNATHLNKNQPSMAFDVGGFTISPDNSTVVFGLREFNNTQHFYSVSVGQSTLTDLITDFSNIESIFNVSFTPDGTRIVFRIYTIVGFYLAVRSIPATGGVPVVLSPVATGDGGASRFTFIDDGSRVIYGFGDSFSKTTKIISADILTGDRVTLAESSAGIGTFFVSPTRDYLLYSVIDEMSNTHKFFSTLSSQSAASQSLFGGNSLGPVSHSAFQLSPDEKQLIWFYSQAVASTFQHDIWSASLETSDMNLLDRTVDNSDISHNADFFIKGDSTRVVFLNDDFDHPSYGPFVVPVSGGEATRIANTDLLIEAYNLSDDGQYVVFSARERPMGSLFKIYSAKLTTLNTALESDICFVGKSKYGVVFTFCL